MRRLAILAVTIFLSAISVAGPNPNPPDASSTAMPKMERFNPDQVDKTLDPCNDFFEYACKKWNQANPIPPDQAGWGTFNSLAIWNVAAVHNTLEASAAAPTPTPMEKQVGSYYSSCMNEDAINKAGITPLKPALDRIDGLKSKNDLPGVVASLHQIIRPANLNFIDAAYPGVLFGIYSAVDFDDARVMLATLDQSGMGLPGREFYLNDDDKSKQIREKYVKYISGLLQLSGEPQSTADSDSQVILSMETSLAKAAMEIITRRDPKNVNNKMSLKQVQALTPSFDWNQYLSAMHIQAQPNYLVTAPDFFRGVEKLIASESLDRW
jgi:putative endopeptidase